MSKRLGYLICILILLLFGMYIPAQASEDRLTVTDASNENGNTQTSGLSKVEQAKDSVVQIVVQYADEDGNKYLLKSGSGFLISNSVVLTNYQNVHLSEEEKEIASRFVSEQTGKSVSFSSGDNGKASYQIGVAIYRDVVFDATVNAYSSKEMDLAILNITDTLNRTKATLGDSDAIDDSADIYALGYKEISVMTAEGTELLSQTDCKQEEGIFQKIVKESQIRYLLHTCRIHKGNAGGPIVDAGGNVIGMSTYRDRDTEQDAGDGFYALSVNEIKGLLDSCEIAYQEAGLFSETDELFVQSEAEEEVKKEVDTNLLDNYIVNFNMLEQSDYTPESYAVLGTALEKAREIKGDKNATQEEVDDVVTQLEIARSGLVLASKINWPFLILILVLIVAILAALILYILYLRGVIGHRGERESLQTLQGMMEASRETLSGNLAAAQHVRPEAVRRPERAPDRGNGTTVLQTSYNQGEGTTVLGVSNRLGRSAYLTRSKTSEKIAVSGNEFVIGKDPGMTNYCISDNSTISRTHAKILCSGAVYYVVDLNSTNSTYLDGRPLHSGEKTELRSGSILRLSDEEFVFHEA